MKKMLALVAVGFISTAFAFNFVYVALTEDTVNVTVKSTERECSGNTANMECNYMVYTDKEVFKNTDSLYYLKFNSSDIQNKLIDGTEYNLTVTGFRIPFFSTYRNIVEVN